jgi:cardiolipin synthase
VPRPAWLTVPTTITLFRIALVPVFLFLELTGRAGWALACFAVASFSDVLDGFLARVLDQRTWLGTVLDPFADKLLGFTAVVALVAAGQLPLWLLLLILFRDLSIICGAGIAKLKKVPLPTTPTRLGKYATFSLLTLIVLALATEQQGKPLLLTAYTQVVGVQAALCIVISTGQYYLRFFRLLGGRSPSHAESKDPTPSQPR